MYNVVGTWLYLIGSAENARKLRARIDGLKPPPLDPMFGVEPKQCPLTVIYGAEMSRRVYADPSLRPALDAWDIGAVTAADLRRWCLEIERGRYTGPAFKRVSSVYARVYGGSIRHAPATSQTDGPSQQ